MAKVLYGKAATDLRGSSRGANRRMSLMIEDARFRMYEEAARSAVERARALALGDRRPLHPLHLFVVLIGRHRQGDTPMVIEGLVEAQLQTVPPASSPTVSDHFIGVLDHAERLAGVGGRVTARLLEDALKACPHPKVALLAEQLTQAHNWEPKLQQQERVQVREVPRPGPAIRPSAWAVALRGWQQATELLEAYLRVAGACPPAELDDEAASVRIREASPGVRAALVELLLCRIWDEDFSAGYGKYAGRSIHSLARALIEDPAIDYPEGYAVRIFEERRALPKSSLATIVRLVERDGMTRELAERCVEVTDRARMIVDETEWDAGNEYDDDPDVVQDMSGEQVRESFGPRWEGEDALTELIGGWTVPGTHGPELDPRLETLRQKARSELS